MTECKVIRDLLPLYVDGVCSEESKKLIEEHLENCDECKHELEIQKNRLLDEKIKIDEKQAFYNFSKKQKKKKRITIFLYSLLIIIVALIIFGLSNYVVNKKLIVYINNAQFNQNVTSIENEETVSFNDLVPFEWDNAYIFYPYTSESYIEETIGFSSNLISEALNDDVLQLIFVKDEKIVASICSSKTTLGYNISFGNEESISYDDDATFTVNTSSDIIKLKLVE